MVQETSTSPFTTHDVVTHNFEDDVTELNLPHYNNPPSIAFAGHTSDDVPHPRLCDNIGTFDYYVNLSYDDGGWESFNAIKTIVTYDDGEADEGDHLPHPPSDGTPVGPQGTFFSVKYIKTPSDEPKRTWHFFMKWNGEDFRIVNDSCVEIDQILDTRGERALTIDAFAHYLRPQSDEN